MTEKTIQFVDRKSNLDLINDIQMTATEVRSICDILGVYFNFVADPLPEIDHNSVATLLWTARNKVEEISEMAGKIER